MERGGKLRVPSVSGLSVLSDRYTYARVTDVKFSFCLTLN